MKFTQLGMYNYSHIKLIFLKLWKTMKNSVLIDIIFVVNLWKTEDRLFFYLI